MRDESDGGAEVDEHGREVDPPAVLAGRVVLRERVVVVVVAVTEHHHRHEHVLGGVDVLVVGSHAPHVRRAVDAPHSVQRQHVAQERADGERVDDALAPVVARQQGRKYDADERQEHEAKPATRQRNQFRCRHYEALQTGHVAMGALRSSDASVTTVTWQPQQ